MANNPDDIPIANLSTTGISLVGLNGAAIIAAIGLLGVKDIQVCVLKIAAGSFLLGILAAMAAWLSTEVAQIKLAGGQIDVAQGDRSRLANVLSDVNKYRAIAYQACKGGGMLFVVGAIGTYIAALFV